MRKRMTSLLLTLVMLLSLVPVMGVSANAAEPTWETVTTYEQFAAAMTAEEQRNVKLGADIDTGTLNSNIGVIESLYVRAQKKLDLNGHTLRMYSAKTAMSDMIRIQRGDLTVLDNSAGQNGRILGSTYNDSTNLINVMQNGKFTLNSGRLEVDKGSLAGESRWKRTINCRDGGEVTINGGTIYVDPETYEGKNNAYGQYFEKEYGDLANGHCGFALAATNECKVTINGGTFKGPVRLDAGGDGWKQNTLRIQINGGTFEKKVMLNDAGDGSVTLTEINNGTFLDYVQAWAVASFENSFSTPEVVINGGEFHKKFWMRPKFPDGNGKNLVGYHVAAKLNGGTFHETLSVDKNYTDYGSAYVSPRLSYSDVTFLADEMLGKNAVQTGKGTFAAQDTSSYREYISYYNKSERWSEGFVFEIKAVNNQPTTIIPNAWGVMESVTLDGNPIDYAKDFKGEVKEITNKTDHTLTFKWNRLADELRAAGYSYDVECDRYISGSTKPTTDTISATDTEYSFTIDKDAPAKVYSFALHLNLKKTGSPYNVGIYSNEHIVKLVVNEAPVVEPDPTIEGTVYYTSGIVYGSPISIAASVTPAEATPAYQWQRSTDGGSTWTNIDGATSGRYTPVAADMGENVRIRVKVTAEGYLGEIVGAALKVSKAANNNYPAVIQLEAVQDGGTYTGFKITNFDSNCEYVYSTTSTPDWSTNQITSATVTGLTSDTTYYVFARFKETATHTAGSIVSSNSIRLYDYVPLDRVLLEGYGSSGTIYIKQGESVGLKVSADPSNANSWNEITFKDEGATTSNITISNEKIDASTGTATPFPNGHTITITGVSTGSANLRASYPSATSSAYGTWYVVVYDDSTVANALRLESVYAYEDITLSENDTAELPTNLPKLLPENSGYHLEWRILKRGTYGASYVTENDNIKLEDGKIKPKAAHTGSEKAQLELVAVKDGSTEYKTLPKTSLFYVTVTAAPVIELTGLTVAPAKVNLELNATYQLSAVKEPVNAAGSLTWASDNETVATVDNTGKVTAHAQGTAIITVTCGTKSASCTVMVAHTHDYTGQSWVYMDPGTHTKTCTAGDNTMYEPHSITSWTDNNVGTHTGTCTDCHYVKTENHSWEVVGEVPPTVDMEGSRSYKCSANGCTATKSESIPKLTEYTVTVKDDGNGTASASPAKAVAGTEITLSAKAKSGYHFKEWQVVTGSVTINDNKFTMPDENVEVKAIFEKNTSTGGGGGGGGVTTYAITVKSAKNGDVTASHKTASKGTTVTLTVDPDKGYVLDTLTVLDGKDKEIKLTEKNGKYTFTMPASKVTVAATFKASAPTGKNPFIDVPAGSYYEDAVVWAVEKGITSGTSATTFNPNGICTRAQAVTFLWRAAGSPAAKSAAMPFADVKAGSYYETAVLWAVENGITKGTSDTMFSPDATCTRAQIVTFLWRAGGSPAVSGNSAFTDVASDAYYAAAVAWAEKNGVTGGIGNGLFGSGNNCTRAQIVTFIYRSVK